MPDTATPNSGDSGAVLVVFALFMSVAVLFAAFVLDAGNWFEHKRHLQVQADAAAFAAAASFSYPCSDTVEKAIYQTAGQYGGAATVLTPGGQSENSATPLYNTQVGGTSQANIHEKINSKTYFGQSAEDKTVEKAPCDPEASMIDVKMTETKLPLFFKVLPKLFNVVPYVNAHARVSIVKQQYASAVEPAIESEPIEARVLYVNDNPDGSTNYNNELLATGLLTNIGSNEEKGTIKWSNASAPVALKITKPHIGVRIALAGKVGALTGAGNEGVAVCNHEYVECFDQDSGVIPPLLNISGYSLETKGKSEPLAPVAHKVTLSTPPPNTCTNGYFSSWPGTKLTPTCTLTVTAEVDYGNASTTGVTVTPEVEYTRGFTNKREKVAGETELAKPAKASEPWIGTAKMPSIYYDNDGSSEINLIVKCKREAKSPCEKSSKAEESFTIKDVQRSYSAGPDGSNRIVAVKVFEPGAANPVPGETDADAYQLCEGANIGAKCEHKLAVTVELKGSLEDAKKYFNKEGQEIPPFHIVYGDNDQESEDQFVVSCPPTTSSVGIVPIYEQALATGCSGKYSVNTHGGSCTLEKAAKEKIAAEEKAQKEAREKEEAGKKTRETNEKAEKTKWEAEEKETKLTKKQVEEKVAAQTATRKAAETKEAEDRAKWEAEEKAKPPKITKKQKEEKLATQTAARVAREATEKVEREKWTAEEKEFKITKAQREAKESAQKTAREAAEKAEATKKAEREAEEQVTKEAKEKQEAAAHECVGLVSVQKSFSSKQPADEENLTSVFQNYFAKRMENPVNGFHEYCPNRWVNNNQGSIPIIPANDSRLIQFFVVPFTVTDFQRKNEVSPLVPINNFATFYVTGWSQGNVKAGQGLGEWDPKERRDGCSERLFKKLSAAEQKELEDETVPLKQREEKEKAKGFDDDTEQPREIVGHLIKYVNVLGEAPGTVTCNLEGLETCEAVLTE